MNYQESLKYLFSLGRELAAPTQAAAAKFDLENISTLAEALGHPEKKYRSVHIAGTNGKGSTAAFTESILRAAGIKTGLYTSPHLEKINERIRVNGGEISDEAFAETFTKIQTLIEELLAQGKLRAHPTFFEVVTALAFDHFAKASVEIAVFEVGLGGRLDATNIVIPEVSVITRVDFDHENFLGHSLREIAGEKAGIIKRGVPLVLAEQLPEARDTILRRAAELGAPVHEIEKEYRVEKFGTEDGCARAEAVETRSGEHFRVIPKLRGRFQLKNALSAMGITRMLKNRGASISKESIEAGITNAIWPGRIEKLQSNPDVYLDGAHNPSAARELAEFVKENYAGRNVTMLFAAMRDKAVDEIAGILFPLASEVIFTQPKISRAISAAQLADMAGEYAARFRVIPDAAAALEEALASTGPSDAVFVTGSLYLVGELRHYSKTRSRVAAL
ncbi:MAG: bifunctional folylpolyglutamate synthase/dihydrofolate synthase [Acidobacteria bacterium]|nr:bifunctional folylpolyglutamate synthase/dihydrofolate synthase [Acidobacteriota bacterium]MBS1866868.1 bifunctional folylpolyglutamate synthase/dihydrofolate synthase [Acidobacteriota bacterium]